MVCLVQVQPASYAVERFIQSLHRGLGRHFPGLPIPRSCSLRLPQDPRIPFPRFLRPKVHHGEAPLTRDGTPPFSSSRGRSDRGGSAYSARNLVCRPRSRGASHLFQAESGSSLGRSRRGGGGGPALSHLPRPGGDQRRPAELLRGRAAAPSTAWSAWETAARPHPLPSAPLEPAPGRATPDR